MPTIKMPNGDLVEMPDNPTPQQLQALGKIHQQQAQPSGIVDAVKEFGHQAWDWTKNLGTAAYKGLADLPVGAAEALAGSYDAQDALVAAVSGKAPRELTPGVLTQQLNDSGYKPKTKAQERVQNIARAAFGAAMNPESGLAAAGAGTARQIAAQVGKQAVKAGVVGGTAGAAAEGAAAVTDNPYARLTAGLAGGAAAGTAQAIRARSNAGSLASRALSDVRPQDLDAAKANMVTAMEQGVPVNLSQAMPQPSNIDAIVETLANNSFGQNVTRQLRDQPGSISMGLEGQLAGLPGDIHASMQEPANMVNSAATKVVQGAKDQRTQAFQDALASEQAALVARTQPKAVSTPQTSAIVDSQGNPIRTAGPTQTMTAAQVAATVPEDAVKGLYDRLGKEAAKTPNTTLESKILDLRDRLKNGESYLTDATQLNEVLKDVTNQTKNPGLGTAGLEAGQSKKMFSLIAQARNDLGDAFVPLKKANNAYVQATADVVDPAKASVTGRLATPRGALPDVEASTAKLQSLFDKGTNPGAQKSEILQLANDLKNVKDEQGNPAGSIAFQDAAKTWFANKLSKVQAPVDGRTPNGIAQRWVQMFGNGMQPTPASQGLRDILAGVAKTQGVAPSTYVKGMENFTKVIGMAAKRPGTVQGVNELALDAAASGNPLSVGNRTRTGIVGNLAARWNEALRADAYREMDRLLTSPEGVDMLKKLAAGSPNDPKVQAAVSTYLGTQADIHADDYGH